MKMAQVQNLWISLKRRHSVAFGVTSLPYCYTMSPSAIFVTAATALMFLSVDAFWPKWPKFLAGTSVTGTCGSAKPSKVADCQNVDMGSCGNACCKMSFVVEQDPLTAMSYLNNSLNAGGLDGAYQLQLTAEGSLGFGDLRAFKIPGGEQFIGQAHHMAGRYTDVVNFNIRPEVNGPGSVIKAFSLSLIAGALGDNGQNYKNILMAMKGAFPDWQKVHAERDDESCPATSRHVV